MAWGVLSLSGVEIEPDYRKIDPALPMSAEAVELAARMKVFPADPRAGVSLLPAFVALRSVDPEFSAKLGNLGGTSRRITDRLFVAHVPPDAVRYVSRWDAVTYVEAAKLARPLLDESRVATSAHLVQSGSGFGLQQAFTGAGVNVGIVDTGLDNAHLDFFNDAGTATRVAQTYAAPFFDAGISANPLVDEEGHGTHVGGIAAGNGLMSSGTFTGMAPGASLFIGKSNFFTTDIVAAVDNLMKASASAGAPIAVNLSLGVAIGPHDGTDTRQASLFTQAINNLATSPPGGKGIIAAAAGNERDREEHFQAIVPAFGTATAFVDDLLVNSTIPVIDVDIWADGEDRYDVTVALLGSETLAVPSGTAASLASGRISVSNRVDAPLNGATHIFVSLRPLSGTTTARIDFKRIRNGGSGKINAYTTSDSFAGTARNQFRDATSSGTITEPANAENVIAVGSFNTKPNGGAGAVGGISSFSSMGPTRDGRMKPDLAAPGSLIYSARSQEADFDPIEIVPPPNDEYVILQGTSMASPHVAGIAALVWESNPNLTGAQMRERLRRTADPVLVDGASPNTTWGSGKVNALRAVDSAVAGITVVPPPGVSAETIPPGTALTLRGDEKSSGPFGQALSFTWSADVGATLTTITGAETTFSADDPGNYPVTLTVLPGSAPSNLATTTLHVNNIPEARITGPAASDSVAAPATFSGQGSFDPVDNQALTFRWVLVSRPAGSAAQSVSPFFVANGDNVTLTPDVAGVYEVGLRVDDGLDNSALTTVSFTPGPVAATGGGGGGGCSVAGSRHTGDLPSAGAAVVLLLLPPAALALIRVRPLSVRHEKELRASEN